jgi:prefoldin subunit 5
MTTAHHLGPHTRGAGNPIEEIHMTTKAHDALDEIRDRIDRLEARANAVEAKVQQLKSAQHALAAELAEDQQAFTDAMHAYLDDFKEFSERLSEKAETLRGNSREQAEAAIGDIRQSQTAVAERLAKVRHVSAERWHDGKESVAAARAELERKADAARKKFE